MDIIESYNFNRSVIEWLKGNYSVTDIIKKSTANHTAQFIGFDNSIENIYKEMKVIKTVIDSKYVLFFNRTMERISQNFLYNDKNTKHKFMVSQESSNIFEVFSNFNQNLIITVTISQGFKLYSSDTMSLRQFY